MSVYADASLQVAAVTPEPSRPAAVEWLTRLAADELLASKWCETEVASALAMKGRTGSLTPGQPASTFSAFSALLRRTAHFIVVDGDHFDRATDLLQRSVRPLRGGDALHLAIADRAGATLWTLDRRMAKAGQALGLGTRLLA